MAEKRTVMTLRGIKKHFPGTKALDWKESDELEIKSGEILGLVGENGAGKSTLFQVIMGIYSKTAGSMTLFDESAPEGRPYEPKNVHDAEDEGIAIIMQQPNFAKNISVSENIFLGQSEKFKNRAGLINWKKQNAAADELLEKFGISHIKSTDILSRLSYEDTKLVEITRALSGNPRILLVDETSAAVSKDSVEKLYSLIRKQRDEGCAVIYISHFIEEVYRLCDRVCVLRDGKLSIQMDIDESVSPGRIIKHMVGRDMAGAVYRQSDESTAGDVRIKTNDLCVSGALKNVNIKARAGEIVGVAGIGGCGSDELGRALFGDVKMSSGSISLDGEEITSLSPDRAIKKGIGYIPKDRDKEGLFLIYDLVMNISASALKEVKGRFAISRKKERKQAIESIDTFSIKTPSEATHISDLSGGNRQKVVIAKWAKENLDVLIVNSPTRGVDIAAKYEIYRILEKLKDQGKAILLISDELPELIGMSDRIYCLKQGEVSGEFERAGFSEEVLMEKMV